MICNITLPINSNDNSASQFYLDPTSILNIINAGGGM